MSRPFKITFSFLLILFPVFSFAQDQRAIDSLEVLLKGTIPDSTRMKTLNELCMQWIDVDPNKSMKYGEEELKIALKTKNSQQEAYAYQNIGNGYFNLADFKSALDYFIKSLHVHEAMGDKPGIGSASGSIGNIYLNMRKDDDAMRYFQRALQIFTELGKKRSTAASLIAIGTVYSDKKDFPKALEYYSRSLKIFEEIGDLESVAVNDNNISDIYDHLGEHEKALEYILKGLEINKQLGNTYGMAMSYNNVGDYYKNTGDFHKAVKFYYMGLEQGQKIDAKEHILSSYKGLAASFAKAGEYKEAYSMGVLYQQLNDTVFNKENSEQMARMQASFDAEKKEREITVLTKDNEIKELQNSNTQEELKKQRIFIYAGLAGLLLLAFLVFYIYRGSQQKNKANKLLEEKNSLIEEKNREITDSIIYAEKIQRAILPAVNEFESLLPESFVLFRPKDIVSGDFHWIAERDGIIYYATADCTGHGVPGGFMSMLGTSLLNEIIIEKKLSDPGEVLDMLRIKIILALKQTGASGENKDGMDMVFCCLDKNEHVLTYAAANNPVWIMRDGKLLEFGCDKQPVGVTVGETIQFTQRKIELQKRDVIYTFTDGYTDQFGGPKGKKLKHKQLASILSEAHKLPMEDQKKMLETRLDSWKGDLQQVDDILIIGVRV